MIIWDRKNGYVYEDEQTHKRYSTYEAKCYEGECTSDIVIIWDDKNNCFANYVYGATFLHESIEELDNTIKFYVDDYEAKRNNQSKKRAFIKYEFTKAGVSAFLDKASTDFFEEMDNGGEHLDKFDIVVTCGKHKISMPLGAYLWDRLTDCLTDAVEDWEA